MIRFHNATTRACSLASLLAIAAASGLTAGCTSTGNIRTKNAGDRQTVLYTFVGKQNEPCTITTNFDKGAPESALVDLAAPFVGELVKDAFDALGTAIQSASEAKSENWTTAPAPLFIARLKTDLNGPISSFKVSYSQHCVRVLVADVSNTPSGLVNPAATLAPVTAPAAGSDAAANAVNADAFKDKTKIEEAIRTSLASQIPDKLGTIRFYGEIELRLNVSSALNQTYYVAQPTVAYYGAPLTDENFKLAAIRLDLNSVFDPKTVPWSITFPLLDDPMLRGELRTLANDPIPASGLLPLPLIATAESNAIVAMQDAASKLKTAYGADLIVPEDDATKYANLKKAVVLKQRAAEDLKCETDGGTNKKKIQLCQDTLTASRAVSDYLDPIALQSTKDQLNASIATLRGGNKAQVGPYNVTVTLTETRDANGLGLLVAKALTSSKTARDSATTNYINGQLGVTADASTTAADNSYRSARFEYDIALQAYNAAKEKGDAADIVTKQRTLIDKYNDLMLKAEAAHQVVTIPPPY